MGALTAPLTLEDLLTRPDLAALPASPLQVAIARAAAGRELAGVLDDATCALHFGCSPAELGQSRPALVVIVAGVRGGKSFMAACAAIHGSLVADLRALRRHEMPRFSIVAPTVDNADATFRLLLGVVGGSPILSRMCVGEPTADTLVLRRPDGYRVEICTVAALRGAVTMRSRWSVGFVLDEVALFGSEPSGAIMNAEELLRAGETRLVPGAQGWLISSPFGPQGLLFDLWQRHHGSPGRVLVVHAPTRALNPAFPLEQIEAIRERSPDTAAREFDAEWIDADTAALDSILIARATRETPLELAPDDVGRGVAFAMDPSGLKGGNAWTLVGATVAADDRIRIVVAREWRGSKKFPLSPSFVLSEIAACLAAYGADRVYSDAWADSLLVDLAETHGLRVTQRRLTSEDSAHMYSELSSLLATSRIELSPEPQLLTDLRGARKIAHSNGVRIVLPRTPDGRHADYCPALVLAVDEAPRAQRRARSGDLHAQRGVRTYVSQAEGFGASLDARDREPGRFEHELARYASGYADHLNRHGGHQ